MACVESVEIVNEIIVENGCPTKQKVAKHCTKNTFGRKKRVINAQQLRAARKCRYPASKPVAPVTAVAGDSCRQVRRRDLLRRSTTTGAVRYRVSVVANWLY